MQKIERADVALIYGGRGREREVSIKGMRHILPLIDQDTYRLLLIFIDKEGRWLIDGKEVFPYKRGFFCPENGEFFATDAAFPLLHGDFGEDGIVQGALECANIPYVGCDVSAGAVSRDKAFVKIIAESLGLPVLPFLTVFRREGVDYAVRRAEADLSYPMFIKPARLGSSVGARDAKSREELIATLNTAFSLSEKVIIEPCLTDKRELECGYFSIKSKELFTNPGEILCGGVYGYEEKYHSDSIGLALRADLEPTVCQAIREYSRRLVRALGVRDISRIDFFLSKDNLYFNEINTLPGFTEGSLYAKMVEGGGISERELIAGLIENARSRG